MQVTASQAAAGAGGAAAGGKATATMLGDYLRPSFDSAVPAKFGESLTVLDDTHGEWLLVQKSTGAEGYVPRSAVSAGPGRIVALYCCSSSSHQIC